jgi:RNA polymerase sigma-70 factor (ECF subfamily)
MIWDFALPAVNTADTAAKEMPMDSDAFAAFYDRNARPLWAYLLRVSGNQALYLFRVATNLLRDHWRRPATSSIDDLPEGMFASMDAGNGMEAQALLGPALALMRPRERQLLWLAHAEGYTHREIAEVTGLGTASIRLLLFRARRKIARLMQEASA